MTIPDVARGVLCLRCPCVVFGFSFLVEGRSLPVGRDRVASLFFLFGHIGIEVCATPGVLLKASPAVRIMAENLR